MLNESKTSSRRALRTRRRRLAPALVAAGAAVGILTTTGFAVASPGAASALEPALSPASAVTLAAESLAAQPIDEATSAARTSLASARVALAEADAVTSAVATSGLDLGTPSTTIDTAELRDAASRLASLDVVPLVLTPDATTEVTAAVDAVTSEVTELRDRLNTGLAKRSADTVAAAAAAKAEAEAAAAAARAQAEAEAQAAAAAAAEAAANANTPEGAKSVARQMASSTYGWGSDQFSCLESLWNKESGWNYEAYNASSGATGIPQSLPGDKMATFGSDWQTNATTQIAWGLDYISAVYGTPCSAWGHSQATDWY